MLSFSFQLGVGGGVFRGVLVMECRLGIFTTEGMDWCVLGVAMGMNLRGYGCPAHAFADGTHLGMNSSSYIPETGSGPAHRASWLYVFSALLPMDISFHNHHIGLSRQVYP